jgi:hypothetical protein
MDRVKGLAWHAWRTRLLGAHCAVRLRLSSILPALLLKVLLVLAHARKTARLRPNKAIVQQIGIN